ncbi:nucleoside hydrolase, partial [Nocardia wallacei]|uniref:nucleoside hydrolase n=1 Tax=Nocardia wallacei TaxID=480035 RepID=UPI00245559DD
MMDVDTGIDDALALLYLLASPEAEITGIAATAGNVATAQVAANNLALLELWRAPPQEIAGGGGCRGGAAAPRGGPGPRPRALLWGGGATAPATPGCSRPPE